MRFVIAALVGLFPIAANAASSAGTAHAASPPAQTATITPGVMTGPGVVLPPGVTGASITVVVENVLSNKGMVKVALCDKSLSEDGCSVFINTPAVVGSVSVLFENIPPGKWGIAAFHDKNSSGDMDTIFGIPQEPYGLSNDAAENMIPTLKDAAIPINGGPNEIHIKLGEFMKK